MTVWFAIFLSGMIAVVPVHFLSVEHTRLVKRYGAEKGCRIGKALGMVSGWGFFMFWFGVWLAPQERFSIPTNDAFTLVIPLLDLAVPIIHVVISVTFLLPGLWLGIAGVMETGLQVAETHRTDEVVTSGVYSIVRHPQYLGGVLSHVGISFLLSGLFALLVTPVIILLNYIISWKEEVELVREFGNVYREYQDTVPMFVPRTKRKIIDYDLEEIAGSQQHE